MEIKIFQVDAFANQPFKGNPAAICLLENPIAEDVMQQIAFENNLSETAFVRATDEGFALRWFTPEVEIDLCGHATLASAHILYQEGIVAKGETIHFFTKSGELTAKPLEDGWIELDFPALPFSILNDVPEDLQQAFGAHIVEVAVAAKNHLVVLDNAALVRDYVPDVTLLQKYRCIITAKGEDGSTYDFISRFFAIPVGVLEDPVTGSAHCCLAPYWASKLGKNDFFAYQASKRGGELKIKLHGERVLFAGQAVTLIKGILSL